MPRILSGFLEMFSVFRNLTPKQKRLDNVADSDSCLAHINLPSFLRNNWLGLVLPCVLLKKTLSLPDALAAKHGHTTLSVWLDISRNMPIRVSREVLFSRKSCSDSIECLLFLLPPLFPRKQSQCLKRQDPSCDTWGKSPQIRMQNTKRETAWDIYTRRAHTGPEPSTSGLPTTQ